MNDVIHIMSSLVDVNGKILVPGINEKVAPVTEDERSSYGPIEFDVVRVVGVYRIMASCN